MANILPRLFRLSAIASINAGLLAAWSLGRPAMADDWNEFRVCTAELLETGITPQLASQACGAALDPKELSLCVLKIAYYTPLSGREALSSCFEVRRPPELASCLIDIDEKTQNPNLPVALDYCRRSLLPERFGKCVVGLSAEVDLPLGQVMENCIDAEDFTHQ
ncbi:MAG: hypothetical protein ACOC0N_01545 [Chroococcales cyanobacterium]